MTTKDLELKTILAQLFSYVKKLGYTFYWAEEKSERHNGFHHQSPRKIGLGVDLSLIDKVIVLAHELGHAIDVEVDPPDLTEAVKMYIYWNNYKKGREYYEREKCAWRYGQRLLIQLDKFELIKSEFRAFKKHCLDGYYAAHKRAVLKGKDEPDLLALNKTIKELRSAKTNANQA